MRFVPLFILAGAVYTTTAVVAQFHIRCQNTIGGPCGDSSRPREYNCCDYGYCQPWNSGYYQCLNTPPKCPKQETDIDYAGNDIKAIYGIQPNQCCEACSTTPGCTAYTFVNQNPDGRPACYLKTSAAGRVEKKGAVSGQLAVDPPPVNCPVQEPNIDYYGNDIKNVIGLTQAQCCDACGATANCAAYTFIPTAMDGKSACYLKYSTAGRRAKAGAISGQVKDVPPPANCPTTEKDTDYYGNDIRTVRDVSLAQCCDACATTTLCKAFSYVEKDWDGKSSCYLKSSAAGKVAKPGVTSGSLKCTTQPLAQCGSASTGALCCPDGTYCQPWNPSYYQCIPNLNPHMCPVVLTNVDYYGGDLEVQYNLVPQSCCDACFKNPDCNFFTFVNSNPDGRSACYLKKTMGEKRVKYGAISGNKILTHGPQP